MNEHHRWLIQQSVDHAVLLPGDGGIRGQDQREMKLYREEYELLRRSPG